ncbi:MAG: chromosome segregation protein SMC [Candidatus Sumerlaeota bacterium]|nr:chromosome segregation protein SMC [Candidatus Sumerlaeota bacterium]
MFFKTLEIYGFKSFAHKTTIEFMPGATIIVGPNGCGKSNILDSIRWVLGEQRARIMRGARMGDVIFNGSASVKAMNIARVSLLLNNENNLLGVDASEIQIGRQLLRTGESEYLINRMPCRARSIHEMLMDTGAGVSAYSILEQGRVDQIVTAKPIERRVIFEEAAGISRYKQRKVETLRKLERTEADLARLADIIREVKGQSISLKRQANRALRYKALDAELTQLEMALISLTYARELAKREEEKALLAKERAALEALDTQLLALEEQLEKERAGAEALEAAIRALQAQLTAEREAASHCERAIALYDERRAAYENQSKQLAEEAETSRAHAAKISAQVGELQAQSEELTREVRRLEEARDEKLERQQALRREQEQHRAELREQQKELEQMRERQRRRENEARLSASRCDTVEAQIKKSREQQAVYAEQQTGLGRRQEELGAEVGRLESQIARQRDHLDREMRDRAQNEETLSRMLTDLESIIQLHSESSSRLNALRELERRYEGYGGGVREVMQAAAGGRLEGVRGVLAHLIRSRSEYETAIEIALGSSVEDIVTDTAGDAARAVEFLRKNELGRARFLPMNSIYTPANDGRFDEIIRRAGVIDIASRLVECDASLRPAVEATLGSTILVEDLDVALGLQREGHWYRYVAVKEEIVVSPEGAITGGDMLPSRLLGREREIDELNEREAELRGREEKLREAVYSHREMLRDGGEKLNQLREETHELDVELARGRNEREQVAQAHGDLARRLVEVEESLGEMQEDLKHTRQHIEGLLEEARQIASRADQMAAQIESRQAQAEAVDHALGEASESLNQAGMELAGSRERHFALRDRTAALQSERDRAVRAAEQKTAQIAVLDEQIASALREQQQARAKLDAARQKRDATEAQQAETTAQREKLMGAIEDMRQNQQTQSREHGQMQTRVHEADLRLQQANLKLEQLDEQSREKFRKTAQEVAAETAILREKLAERKRRQEEQARAQSEAAQAQSEAAQAQTAAAAAGQPAGQLAAQPASESAPAPASRTEGEEAAEDEAEPVLAAEEELLFDLPEDAPELRARIAPLREQITRLGPINTVAIEEYEQLRQRYTFLQGQEKDMTEARESLIKTIKTIDKTSREMFETAFNAINAHFQDMFRRLFSGGKAYLKLEEDAEDVLEAGVEIFAQPPGKQLAGLSMMSGGEKALTAIAVMFAIFQYHPSPFCVLDEIDAPLDDANCQRLVDMLREFSKTVQFIIITHNKITMQLADTIYGVTMEEPGVTRVLSIPRHLLKDPNDVRRHAREQRQALAAGQN